MNPQHFPCGRALAAQRGQIIIMIVLIMAIGTGFLVFSLSDARDLTAKRNAQTDAALRLAKEALIGWSAARTPTAGSPTVRPGELPCPDKNNDGMDNDGGCSAGDIGRIPWKTLGIQEPRDGYGETLWYAVAGPFRYKPQNPGPITSDSLGNITVNQGSTIQTSQAIAVLFAPGLPLGSQTRGTTTAACSTTGTTIRQQNCAANYLESTGGGNNAQTGGPFIQAASTGTFNDRVLAITNADLMPLVEQRVARELMVLLNQYYAVAGVYPWADLGDGKSNGGPTAADGYYNRNRFPACQAKPMDWIDVGITLPDWLTNGCPPPSPPVTYVYGWTSVIYYGVAKNMLEGGGANCTNCFATSTLTVNNPNSLIADLCSNVSGVWACQPTVIPSGSADLVLITPGAATASRISGWSTSSFSTILNYFEDNENSDNNDDTYVVPSSTKYDRDRLYIVR